MLMLAMIGERVSYLTLFTLLGFFGFLNKCIIFGTIDKPHRRCGKGFSALEKS